MAQWHSCSILHHIMKLTRGFDTMHARFEWKHSQYSPIMASQCFHCWLCPKGNQLHQVKSLSLPPFYLANCQLFIIHVTCPNGCQHWLYLNPPSFIYNAFAFLKVYMAKHYHFLMFVACEKNMEKKTCIKIKDPTLRNNVLHELGNIMYDKDGPFAIGVGMWAMNRLQFITSKYHAINVFWKYMEENWWHKTHMCVVGFWNLPYDGQGTNAAIESYHGTLHY